MLSGKPGTTKRPGQAHDLLRGKVRAVLTSHAARCVACHGVRSHPVPVALVGEWSIPVV
jgi:mono/diheme cytochrome c family protein